MPTPDFVIAQLLPTDGDVPSLLLAGMEELERHYCEEMYGNDDLVQTDHVKIVQGYRDQRVLEKVILLAVTGLPPQTYPVGEFGFPGIPATGDVAVRPDQVVGSAWFHMDKANNEHLAESEALLARDQEVKAALLEAVEAVMRQRDRTTVTIWEAVPTASDDEEAITDPTGNVRLPAADQRVRFALDHGFTLAQAERHSVQPLPVPPDVLVPALDRSRAEAAGYDIVTYLGPTPAQYLDSVARLYEAMSTDPPLGEVDWRPETWDTARVEAVDDNINLGQLMYTTVARHLATGKAVAFTQIDCPNSKPAVAYQHNTVVLKDHRGHGLGMLIKAVNANEVSTQRPSTQRVHTWNADENDHMLAINIALGYRPVNIEAAWQKVLS